MRRIEDVMPLLGNMQRHDTAVSAPYRWSRICSLVQHAAPCGQEASLDVFPEPAVSGRSPCPLSQFAQTIVQRKWGNSHSIATNSTGHRFPCDPGYPLVAKIHPTIVEPVLW